MPEGPGRQLREARTALKLSRVDVATALRLKPEIIAALEADDTGALPAPIYVNGYLRNYARLVDIPVEPLLEAFAKLQVEAPTVVSDIVQPHDRGQARRVVQWVGVLVFGAVLAGFVSWLQNQDLDWITDVNLTDSSVDETATTNDERVVDQAVLPTQEPVPTAQPEMMVEELPAEMPSSPLTETVADAPLEPAPVKDNQGVREETVATAVQEPATHRLVLRMDEDCWVEITDADGRRLVYDLVRAGQTHESLGAAPFEVFLGNAAGVHMEVDGQDYDFSEHIRGNLARFTVMIDEDA